MTDTIACPSASEIAGYCSTCGLTVVTFFRFSTNSAVPGTFLLSSSSTALSSPTEVRIGRSPVCSENALTCSGADSHFTKSMAACLRWSPLSNTTQLSGPAMV